MYGIAFALVLHWFYMFWFHKINQNNAALVRLSPKNFRILWISLVCPSYSKLRNQQNMIVVDLRGQDRASGAIPGTAHIPAMDLLKEIGTYVEKFRHQPIVAFFCQYSAHRAPTVAGCICSIF